MVYNVDNPSVKSPDQSNTEMPRIQSDTESTVSTLDNENPKLSAHKAILDNQDKTRDSILGTALGNTLETVPETKTKTKKINKNSQDIKQIVLDFKSEEPQKREQSAKTILRFIHFHIRKERHQSPTKYMRNGQANPNGLNEHDMDDAVQYVFLHVLENSHKINTDFDKWQVRLYLNKMIASGYCNWYNRQGKLINIPKSQNNERKNLPMHYNQFDEYDSTIENSHLINSLDDENTGDAGIGNLCTFKNPEKELLQNERKEIIENLFNEFPRRERIILHERFVKGTPYHIIGEKVGLSTSCIETTSNQFIEKMRKKCPSRTKYGKAREKIKELRSN